jgi:hypothetical protein
VPRTVTRDWVVRRRLATQLLSSVPAAGSGEAVRRLTGVQAQDAPLAAHSLAMRSRTTTYAGVLAEQASGSWVRTHALRPTWHHLATEDLRWIQALTGARVERSVASVARRLGLTEETKAQTIDVLRVLLAGPTPMTRKEIGVELAARSLSVSGEATGQLLMAAELRSVVCSGPPRGVEHTYVLVDDVVPPAESDGWSTERSVVELARRFYSGHGPASERDLHRWSGLPLTQVRAATAELGDRLEQVECDGEVLLFDPAVRTRTSRRNVAYLLSTFDEVALTYPRTGFPRRAPSADRTGLLGEAGGGIVVVDGHDVGTFGRKVGQKRVTVTVRPESRLAAAESEAVAEAAAFLAAFHELPLDLVVG